MNNHNQNQEAERAVLGGIMLDDVIGMHACQTENVTPETFTHPKYRAIYATMLNMQSRSVPIDTLSVGDALRRTPIPNINIDVMDLSRMMDFIETVYHIENYVEIIKEKERIRNIEQNANRAIQACTRGTPSYEITSEIMQKLTEHTRRVMLLQLKDLRDDKIRQWKQARSVGFTGIPSGFRYLNQYLGGYRAGVNTILGAFRGEGKTTIARQEALSMAKAGIPVLFVSLEDPADMAAAGIVGNHGDFSVFQHDIGHGTEVSINQAEQAWDTIGELPIWITTDSMTIEQIRSLVTMAKQTYDIKVVIVDHLQYILSSKRHNSRNDEVSYYSHQLCALWKHLDIVGITLSQFSRSAEKEQREPRLSDLRDSGSIEQDARAVLLLYWDGEKNRHILKVAKNNYGPSGAKIVMERIGNRQRFEERGVMTDDKDTEENLSCED